MEIGNDDLDFMDEAYGPSNVNDTTTQDTEDPNLEVGQYIDDHEEDNTLDNDLNSSNEEDFISVLLKDRGIEDKSKIKFENDEGNIEEVDWDSLSNEDRLNVLNSSNTDSENDLDDSEIQLINAIRQSNLSPDEYIRAIQLQSINSYLQQSENVNKAYKIDDINDDDLFVMDLISRTLDITEEEALEALDRAKQNEALFKKLIGAMRADYKRIEDENLQYEELRKQQQAQEQFNTFADSIETSISNFTELAGGKLDMDQEDMQELYDFITGFDAAGNSYFGKALNDPDTLVKMAWFALNGEDTIREIEDYYNKEITRAREEGYKKGLQNPKVIHKNIQKPKSEMYSDLDDI